MPKLKSLSGKEVIKIFLSFGFNVAAQKGSHIKLARVQKEGARQTLTIPNHFEIDKGTLTIPKNLIKDDLIVIDRKSFEVEVSQQKPNFWRNLNEQ